MSASLASEIIKQLLKPCVLNLNVDSSEDAIICFKESKIFAAGRQMLKSQKEVSRDLGIYAFEWENERWHKP